MVILSFGAVKPPYTSEEKKLCKVFNIPRVWSYVECVPHPVLERDTSPFHGIVTSALFPLQSTAVSQGVSECSDSVQEFLQAILYTSNANNTAKHKHKSNFVTQIQLNFMDKYFTYCIVHSLALFRSVGYLTVVFQSPVFVCEWCF